MVVELDISSILVDRLVNFMYLGVYQRNLAKGDVEIMHATNPPLELGTDWMHSMKSVRFRLETIDMSEQLNYPAVIDRAMAMLIDQLVMRRRCTPNVLRDFVE